MPVNSLAILEGPNLTATAGAALAIHIRVKLDASGNAVPAGILEKGIGITKQPIASGSRGIVRLNNAPGTQIGVASETIVVGDTIYTAANGAFSKTSAGAVEVGQATSAAAAGEAFTFVWRQ